MADYQLISSGTEIRHRPTGTLFPTAPGNPDYQAYLAWLAEGNVADPADPPVPQFTIDRLFSGRVQTTNATPTEIFRGTLLQATGYIATLDIIGVLAVAPFDRAIIRASAGAARAGAGAILDGQDVMHPPFKTAGAAAWNAQAAVSGNDFIARVIGEANKTINWTLRGNFYQYTPGGF